jgi:hypothetical protein
MSRRPGEDDLEQNGLPDEELPRRLDEAERALARDQRHWFAWSTLLAGLAAGVPLLLPWTFSRRLGLSVWQLGIEDQPALGLTWLVGLAASGSALFLTRQYATAAATVAAIVALIYAAGAWQASTLEPAPGSWPGPGPALAVVTGVTWVLCATAQLIADRPRPPAPTDPHLQPAITRLRRTRSQQIIGPL